MEKKYPIGGTVTILINVDSNTIESVYVDTAEAIDACRNNRNLSPLTFPIIGRAATPQGIGWVKAETKPEHNVGVLVFIPGEDNHITSGMWDISNEWVLLDEYRTPEEEVTHWMPLPGLPEGIEGRTGAKKK